MPICENDLQQNKFHINNDARRSVKQDTVIEDSDGTESKYGTAIEEVKMIFDCR